MQLETSACRKVLVIMWSIAAALVLYFLQVYTTESKNGMLKAQIKKLCDW